jgi:hypothetical protein
MVVDGSRGWDCECSFRRVLISCSCWASSMVTYLVPIRVSQWGRGEGRWNGWTYSAETIFGSLSPLRLSTQITSSCLHLRHGLVPSHFVFLILHLSHAALTLVKRRSFGRGGHSAAFLDFGGMRNIEDAIVVSSLSLVRGEMGFCAEFESLSSCLCQSSAGLRRYPRGNMSIANR